MQEIINETIFELLDIRDKFYSEELFKKLTKVIDNLRNINPFGFDNVELEFFTEYYKNYTGVERLAVIKQVRLTAEGRGITVDIKQIKDFFDNQINIQR